MRKCYDSVTPHNILQHDTTPQIVAGYAHGRYAWDQADWNLFPNAVKIRIAVRANFYDAHVLDCEPGDATPAQCPDWAWTRKQMGGVPIIYCNRSTWPQVRDAFDSRHMEQPLYWIATANGRDEIPFGAIGAQYLLNYQGVDVSVMADFIPGVDPHPIIPDTGEDDMTIVGKSFSATPERPQDYVSLPCNGKRSFFISIGGNDVVEGLAYFLQDTPAGKGGQFAGKNLPFHIDGNRPGPIPVPADCRVIILGITRATHEFTAWCQ